MECYKLFVAKYVIVKNTLGETNFSNDLSQLLIGDFDGLTIWQNHWLRQFSQSDSLSEQICDEKHFHHPLDAFLVYNGARHFEGKL